GDEKNLPPEGGSHEVHYREVLQPAHRHWKGNFITIPCMSIVRRATLILPILLTGMLYSVPASAQVDFTGVWNGNTNAEDGPERAAGPSLVEFMGLPINDQARQWGVASRPGRLSLTEHQCQVHVVHYIHRGPFSARIWEERDPVTHQLIAIHQAIGTYEQQRTIWIDRRAPPGPNAAL